MMHQIMAMAFFLVALKVCVLVSENVLARWERGVPMERHFSRAGAADCNERWHENGVPALLVHFDWNRERIRTSCTSFSIYNQNSHGVGSKRDDGMG